MRSAPAASAPLTTVSQAYAAAAANSDRLDYVQHLGDYVYEC